MPTVFVTYWHAHTFKLSRYRILQKPKYFCKFNKFVFLGNFLIKTLKSFNF